MDLGGCRVDQLWYTKSTHDKPFLWHHNDNTFWSHSSHLFTSPTYILVHRVIYSIVYEQPHSTWNQSTPVHGKLIGGFVQVVLEIRSGNPKSLRRCLHTQHNKPKQNKALSFVTFLYLSVVKIESFTRSTIMCAPHPHPHHEQWWMWSWPSWI